MDGAIIKMEEGFDQFESFVTGYYHFRHIWTPRIGEELTTAQEPDNTYDKFAVSVLKDETIVGHVPRQISKQCTALLKSGGIIKLKVTGNPINTKISGIRVPCTYIISGDIALVENIKDYVKLKKKVVKRKLSFEDLTGTSKEEALRQIEEAKKNRKNKREKLMEQHIAADKDRMTEAGELVKNEEAEVQIDYKPTERNLQNTEMIVNTLEKEGQSSRRPGFISTKDFNRLISTGDCNRFTLKQPTNWSNPINWSDLLKDCIYKLNSVYEFDQQKAINLMDQYGNTVSTIPSRLVLDKLLSIKEENVNIYLRSSGEDQADIATRKKDICEKCGKTLANRHNLSRHKKSCR